jgi:hypothetical protein
MATIYYTRNITKIWAINTSDDDDFSVYEKEVKNISKYDSLSEEELNKKFTLDDEDFVSDIGQGRF